jgi:hypothetical protein
MLELHTPPFIGVATRTLVTRRIAFFSIMESTHVKQEENSNASNHPHTGGLFKRS